MDYAKHYAALIERARPRPLFRDSLTHEVHHIVPRCMGGGEERENVVSLTLEEHCIAHILLAKMYPEHPGIAYAAKWMSALATALKRPANKRYGRAKRAAGRRWAKLRGNYCFRLNTRKPKRYTMADVMRLEKMLAPRTKIS